MIPQLRVFMSVEHIAGGTDDITLENADEMLDWDKAKMVLERDDKGHGLVEMLVAPFQFIGIGYEFLKGVDDIDGPDAKVFVRVDVKFDNSIGYELLHNGMVKMSAMIDLTNKGGTYYLLSLPILGSDIWSKFIAALDKPVDVLSDKDIYGEDVDVATPKTLRMVPQKILQRYEGHATRDITRTITIPAGEYAVIDFSDIRTDEIKNVFSLTEFQEITERPAWKFSFKYGGAYSVFSDLYFFQGPLIGSSPLDNFIKIYAQINDDAPVAFGKTDEIGGIDEWSHYDMVHDFLGVIENSRFRLYMKNETAIDQTVSWFAGVLKDSYILIRGATEYKQTTSDAMLIHDVGYAIIDRIVGQDTYHKFLSPILGHTAYTVVEYDDDGCEWMYIHMLGVHVRGLTMDVKKFFQTWSKWFESASASFNLGYGTRIIDDKEYIVVDKKETFYNNNKSMNFVGVAPIKRTYDESCLYSKIDYGYKKGDVESEGGTSDPQVGVHTRLTRFERVGTPISFTSDNIAAAGAIEQTRRQQLKPEQDYKTDKETIIIAINKVAVDVDVFDPELDENFTAVLGVTYPDKIYNLRLMNIYSFLRWINVFAGGLLKYPGSSYTFQDGSGNYNAGATMDPASECLLVDAVALAQSDIIPIDVNTQRKAALHKAELLQFVTGVSWDEYKTIRANRDKAIGVSSVAIEGTFDSTFDFTFQGAEDAYPCHIKRLEWWIKIAKGDFLVWPAVIE